MKRVFLFRAVLFAAIMALPLLISATDADGSKGKTTNESAKTCWLEPTETDFSFGRDGGEAYTHYPVDQSDLVEIEYSDTPLGYKINVSTMTDGAGNLVIVVAPFMPTEYTWVLSCVITISKKNNWLEYERVASFHVSQDVQVY